eukprot:365965-Chlamydomonas_euryale.AAC.1
MDQRERVAGQMGRLSTGQMGRLSTGQMGRLSTGQMGRVSTGQMGRVSTGQMGRVSTGPRSQVQPHCLPLPWHPAPKCQPMVVLMLCRIQSILHSLSLDSWSHASAGAMHQLEPCAFLTTRLVATLVARSLHSHPKNNVFLTCIPPSPSYPLPPPSPPLLHPPARQLEPGVPVALMDTLHGLQAQGAAPPEQRLQEHA